MTNLQIITNEAVANNLFTESEIENFLNEHGFLPLNTYAAWKQLGYQVKRGEKNTLSSYIWGFANEKEKKNENTGEKSVDPAHHYKRKAFFFTISQVERIKKQS